MNKIAKRDDWKTVEMPLARTTIAIKRQYSEQEFGRLSAGKIPQAQEDKWFVFYEKPVLFLHRSWTGFCVFEVGFQPDGKFFSITSATVNRDQSQYTEQKR